MNFYEQAILLIHTAKDQVKSRDLWVWEREAVTFPFAIIEVRLRMHVGHIWTELLPLFDGMQFICENCKSSDLRSNFTHPLFHCPLQLAKCKRGRQIECNLGLFSKNHYQLAGIDFKRIA